ncbi:glycosyltransferase, partial [Roseomonas mucosa]
MNALAPSPLRAGARASAPLVVMLSAAHPPEDVRVVGKEGAALAAAGWRVWHLCPQPASGVTARPPAQSRGVFLVPYRRRTGWLGRLLGIPALARRARACDAAVLHASEPDSWLAALIAARGRDTRVVLDVHEHYPSRLDHRLPRALRPVLAPLARAAIRRACRAMAARADAVVVAKDGLDEDFRAAPRLAALIAARGRDTR